MSLFGMTTKVLVYIVLLLPAVPLSHSACFYVQKDPSSNPQFCIDSSDRSVRHAVGSSWTTYDCKRCRCSEGGYGCCDIAMRPAGYSNDCVAVLDRVSCDYRVHRKDNPSIECPVPGYVGK